MKKEKIFAGTDGIVKDKEACEIAILPVPYDGTSTWIKGADKGPLAVIEASYALEMYDIETDSEVYLRGIHTCQPVITGTCPEEMVKNVDKAVSLLIDSGKFVVTLGGEHSVSAGAVKAHSRRFENFSVLQLDAHSDLRQEYEGTRYNHACIMARVREICPFAQVGIRSMDIGEKAFIDMDRMFFAGDIAGREGWFASAADKLTENVYVTIDLDVFDPSVMPSTGTPEPGGLDWYTVTGFLREVTRRKNVVGFDVVELCPQEGNKAPDFLAAKLIYKFLSYIYLDR
ncbi:MAG: agmatinase [Candidatus Omnitrophota bacterium]